jgi:hypothetical protein
VIYAIGTLTSAAPSTSFTLTGLERRVMRDFRKGKIKILIATEAAGMVCALYF